ncbi:hypothetical protein [Flavobacterium sp. I3-2]|uniref:hypothetical protein n=1 Tax=Flavobacterium sp. I3-2 TaxID=2748319 RepID=UPI00210547E6|nr:hypothetical protein [Flavobacterium sp. I3-2]
MTVSKNKMLTLSRFLVAFAGLLLLAALFFPIWQIQLSAPQYPEGLELYIHASKLSGDVQIINGLNHYIGMRELHENDFIEFTVLPYIIGFIGILGIISAVLNKRKWFIIWLIIFVLFGVAAIIDFYLWLYDYGHNLDPKAPIQVPGMTYQPPLVGFKQLLNFGAYSIPAIGGWLMLAAAFFSSLVLIFETKFKKNKI